jgi:hypothetical protein
MNWLELLRSTVVAAVITGVVATIGFLVSSATAKRINKDKLALDKELAETKVAAEVALAERKAALDRGVTLAKRKAEVAEKVLAEFYEARRALQVIRSPFIWAAEMVAEEGVGEDVITNEGYGVHRRMRQYSELFSRLEATRFTYGALFGNDAAGPYDRIIKVHNQVFHAAEALLKYRHQEDQQSLKSHLQAMRRAAFSMHQLDDEGNELADKVAVEIDELVAQVEIVCRATLSIDRTT